METRPTLPTLLAPLNDLVTPGFRLGLANPLPFTTGFVILEVVGRRSGQLRSVPLLCTDYGSALVVSTVRSESQWLKNLAAAGEAEVWLRGSKRHVTASVYRSGERLNDAASSSLLDGPAGVFSRASGMAVAVLSMGRFF